MNNYRMMSNQNEKKYSGLEIAVIGMAIQCPGAENYNQYWSNIINGKESITFLDDNYLDEIGVSPEMRNQSNYVKSAGGILPYKNCFDAPFFGYSSSEAEMIDPQVRKFHECVWAAIEDGGYNLGNIKNKIGLYAGAASNFNWLAYNKLSGKSKNIGEFLGNLLENKDFLTTRISHNLNLKGPSFFIQTACSTSLVAIHVASRALLLGECDMALAGGVSVNPFQEAGYLYNDGFILSKDGHCRAFDHKSSGTIGGNGCGVVLLKTLKRALQDNDNIHAIIKGSAINNDGSTKVAFSAPSITGQSEVFRSAYKFSKIDPTSIKYVECHATGTELGDPIEVEALKKAFNTDKKQFCAVGTVKSNVGHLDIAAGVAGFIKSVLVLKNKQIPPSINFEKSNPKIDFLNSPFYVSLEAENVNLKDKPFRVAVSSLGIGGTNAHVVLEEAPERINNRSLTGLKIIPFSAKSESALENNIQSTISYLKEKCDEINIEDLAYVLQNGRQAFNHRKIVLVNTIGELIEKIDGDDSQIKSAIVKKENISKVFMFPGQGGQYINMGKGLYEQNKYFKELLDECFDIIRQLKGIDVKEILFAPEQNDVIDNKINNTEYTQPLIFSIEYSLAQILIKLGVKPDYMIGHSIGEYVAACISGVLSLSDAIKLVVKRGELIQSLPKGDMMSINIDSVSLKKYLSKEISLAAVNSSKSCVVSGKSEEIEKLKEQLEKENYDTKKLYTSHAFHSYMMESIYNDFREVLSTINFNSPNIPYVSNVTGELITLSELESKQYWITHLRETVNFKNGVEYLTSNRNCLFIEVGPGKALSSFIKSNSNVTNDIVTIDLIRHPNNQVCDFTFFLNKIAELWLYGAEFDWKEIDNSGQRISLPVYSFDKIDYEIDNEFIRKIAPIFYPDAIEDSDDKILNLIKKQQQINSQKIEPLSQKSVLNRPNLLNKYKDPNTIIEKEMVEIWQNSLGVDKIGIIDDFFDLGGDSLKLIKLIARISEKFKKEISIKDFYKYSTISKLAGYISESKGKIFSSIFNVEKKEYYPLSSAQKRQYLIQKIDKKNTDYNILSSFVIQGEYDNQKVESIWQKLVNKYEVLRTQIIEINSNPVQQIVDHIDIRIEEYSSEYTYEKAKANFLRSFNLNKAPFFRVGVVSKNKKEYLLMIDMHHIITDGTSTQIIFNDLFKLYRNEPLNFNKIQYKDYASWQSDRKGTSEYVRKKDFWLDIIGSKSSMLQLPFDKNEIKVKSDIYSIENIWFSIGENSLIKLKNLARELNITLFSVVLAIYYLFLNKISRQSDIIIGFPVAGRSHPDLEKMIGMLVNTLALKNIVPENQTFLEFLKVISNSIIDALENQDFQFEDLVKEIQIEREKGKNPLFNIMLVFQNISHDYEPVEKLDVKNAGLKNDAPGFDLVLRCKEINNKLECSFQYYNTSFFKETIEKFASYFTNLVNNVAADNNQFLDKYSLLSGDQKEILLQLNNNTDVDYPENKVIHEIFEKQVESTPNKIALIYEDNQLTYDEFNRKSNQVANYLRSNGVDRNSVVAISLSPSLEMLISLIGVLKSGAVYMPIDPDYPQHRKNFMLEDSEAQILITNNIVNRFDIKDVKTINVEEIFKSDNKLNPQNVNKPFDVAYIIYTSGTTGKSKGTLIEHRNVVRLFFNSKDLFDFNKKDIWTLFHSFCFDFSVWEMYGALLFGGELIIIPRMASRDVEKFHNCLERSSVTVINQTPTAFQNLSNYECSLNESRLNLRFVIFGGEALNPGILKEWKNKYPQNKLINMYGITETTVHVTYKEIGLKEIKSNQSNIGNPIPTLGCLVCNDSLDLVPTGVPGEICVIGEGLSRGYLNRPELTFEKFCANPFSKDQKMYKSGDLGKINLNGEIEYYGRIDQQIKLRGHRIELGEIQYCLSQFDGINDNIVILINDDRDRDFICAYFISDKNINSDELRQYTFKHLPSYMVPSVFMKIEEFPVTSNGKLDISKLPRAEFCSNTNKVLPQNKIEEKVLGIWEQVLKVRNISTDDNYFTLGGDSIIAIRLINLINDDFKIKLEIADLYENQDIKSFSKIINNSNAFDTSKAKLEIAIKLEKAKVEYLKDLKNSENIEDIYPMSDIQIGMIFHSIQNSDLSVYHDQMLFQRDYKSFNIEQFKKAVILSITKHSILRTSFNLSDFEEALQFVYKTAPINLIWHDLSEVEINQKKIQFSQILKADKKNLFDVKNAPLWRINIVQMGSVQHFVFTFHHAILDGWSVASLMTEINNNYVKINNNETLEIVKLNSTYRDYIIEQFEIKKSLSKEFWENELDDYKQLNFKYLSEKKDLSDETNIISHLFEKDLVENLLNTSADLNIHVKNICFAAYLYMLGLISYDQDIVVGLISNNRPIVDDGDKILGCFLNTIPFRWKFDVNTNWIDFVKGVDSKLIELKKHEKLPLFDILQAIRKKSLNERPLIETYFNYTDFHIYKNIIKKTQDEKIIKSEFSEFKGHLRTETNFNFHISAMPGNLEAIITFDESFISAKNTIKLLNYFKEILKNIIQYPESKISSIEILSKEEKKQLLYDFNSTQRDFSREKNVCQLFEEQVKKTPNKNALIFEGKEISYSELNKKSNQIAHFLKNKGVTRNSIVALLFEPSHEMIISLLGVIKIGAGYLPINTELPDNRISYLLDDSKSVLVLTNRLFNNQNPFKIDLIHVNHELFNGESKNFECFSNSNDLIYIIYTSGTTGKPKGVILNQGNLLNYINWFNSISQINKEDKTILTTSYSFDLGYTSIYSSLLNGCELHLVPKELYLSSRDFNNYIIDNKITYLKTTPTLYLTLVDCPLFDKAVKSIRLLILGGESILTGVIERSISLNENIQIINHYGPTEATIGCVYFPINKSNYESFLKRPVIGSPIHNTQVYIFDKYSQIQPIGIPGELMISGEGVARGYLGNPELTSEKFINHPFKEGERLYKTGDLARRLPDGNIEFLGRIDDQVKIRGFRIELGEIENVLLKHESIKESAVIAKEENGGKYLCAYLVCEREINQDEIRTYLSVNLPEYMIPSYFVELDKIPLTSNGKVNRKALPSPEIKAGEDYLAPSNETEENLVKIWSEVLNIPKKEISTIANFFAIGGHSLKVMALITRVHKILGYKLDVNDVFKYPTIRLMAELLELKNINQEIALKNVEKKEYYPSSSGQERLYITRQIDKDSMSFNISAGYIIESKIDIDVNRVKGVLNKIIERHPSFRTKFMFKEGSVVQVLKDEFEFEFEFDENERDNESDVLLKKFIKPFNLEKDPLIRFFISKISKTKIYLLVDMHHIISDGFSMSILISEFFRLYNGEKLPKLKYSYVDYSEWQNNEVKQNSLFNYWIPKYSGNLPTLNLDTDFQRPLIKKQTANHFKLSIEANLSKEIIKYIQLKGITPFMFFTAAYSILLSKYSEQEDIIIGFPLSGRNHYDIEKIIGIFANLLPIRCFPRKNVSFDKFIDEVKKEVLEILENQDFQFENLLRSLNIQPESGRHPLFDCIITMNNFDDRIGSNNKLIFNESQFKNIKQIRKSELHIPSDLMLNIYEFEGLFNINMLYSVQLYKESTISMIVNNLIGIIRFILKNNNTLLSNIKLDLSKFDTAICHELKELEDLEF